MGNLSGGKWTADEYQRAARPLSPWLGALLRDPELWTRMPDQVDVMPPQSMLQAGLDGRREDAVKQLAARMCQPDAGCEFLVIPGDE